MVKESYALPTGGYTRSRLRYVSAWRRLGRSVASLYGGKCIAFDPDLSFVGEDGRPYSVPTWQALKLYEVLECGE